MFRGGRAGRSVVSTVGVAVGLTLLALVGAILLRPGPSTDQTGSGVAVSLPAGNAPLRCDNSPCQSLAGTSIAGSSVQLLANAAGTSGRVRIVTAQGLDSVFETTIGQLGATLGAQSLTCVSASTPACLVSGSGPDGGAGEVFVQTDGDWDSAAAPYFASGNYLALRPGSAQGPEVITAQLNCDSDLSAQCANAPVYLQIFTVNGNALGCTTPVSKLDRLPGWPDVNVSQSQLHPCS